MSLSSERSKGELFLQVGRGETGEKEMSLPVGTGKMNGNVIFLWLRVNGTIIMSFPVRKRRKMWSLCVCVCGQAQNEAR